MKDKDESRIIKPGEHNISPSWSTIKELLECLNGFIRENKLDSGLILQLEHDGLAILAPVEGVECIVYKGESSFLSRVLGRDKTGVVFRGKFKIYAKEKRGRIGFFTKETAHSVRMKCRNGLSLKPEILDKKVNQLSELV